MSKMTQEEKGVLSGAVEQAASEDEMRWILKTMQDAVGDLIAKFPQSLVPQCLISHCKGTPEIEHSLFVCDVTLGSQVEKSAAMHAIASACCDLKLIPCCIALATEAWSSIVDQNEKRKYLLPEHDPDRKEIVLVQVMTIAGHCTSARATITRDGGGLIKSCGEWETADRSQSNILQTFYRHMERMMLDGILGREVRGREQIIEGLKAKIEDL